MRLVKRRNALIKNIRSYKIMSLFPDGIPIVEGKYDCEYDLDEDKIDSKIIATYKVMLFMERVAFWKSVDHKPKIEDMQEVVNKPAGIDYVPDYLRLVK